MNVMKATLAAEPQIVNDYWRLFVNRRAYTLQSMRPHPETGRHYYYRAKENGTDAPLGLTEVTICQHLEGEITVGCTQSTQTINVANGWRSMPTTRSPWRTC
jgi:hypothetical protein